MAQVGGRYFAPSGAEVIVTKGGPGTLSDGASPLTLRSTDVRVAPIAVRSDAAEETHHALPELELGKLYGSADGTVNVLIIKPGPCDLRYNGEPMERMNPPDGMGAGVRVPRTPWSPLQGAAEPEP